MKKLFTLKTLMLSIFCLVSIGSWAYTLPSSTMNLGTVTSSTMEKWVDESSYSLSDDYLVVSGYASYKSVDNQKWITTASTGSSSSSWETIDNQPFKGSSFYTTAKYATIQSGRSLAYRVTNAKSISVYGKNNTTSKYIKIDIYEVTDEKAATTATYSLTYTTDANPHVWSQTLTASKEYLIDITGVGTSNSQVYEVAFERNASTDPIIEANAVNIEASATSGSISYTLTNAKSGATLSASTTAIWLSNLAVDTENSKVTFTSETNTSTTENRSATVTLTYKASDGTTVLATKDVTVTQSKFISYTNYDKVSASTMVIGGTYVWYGEKSDGSSKSVATSMGSNAYFGAETLADDSKVTDTQLQLTTETPQLFTFSQTTATEWTIADAGTPTNYLYVSGDKKIAWGTTANVWTLSGTDDPAFSCSSYNSTAYTLFANLNSPRFNAYTAIGTMQNAILYHLNGEATSKLTLNDGTTSTDYTVKQGFAWVPIVPEKDGFIFQGWTTTDGGEVAYAENVAYTMGTSDATLYAVWKAQTTKPAITTNIESTYSVVKGNSVTLTIAAENADSYQWYSNTTNSTEGATAIADATSETYTYTGTTKDNLTYIFCAVTNSVGTTNSTIAAVTTVGSPIKQLLKAEYSNSFDAFITEPTDATNGKVQVYYMKGETAPTLNTTTVKVSDDATYEVSDATITVTAEDGTKAIYEVTETAVEPMKLNTSDGEFNGSETWVKTGYGFVSGKGIAFSKNDADWSRESIGKNRIYIFVGPATSVKLTNTLITSDRNIKVYVNGTEQTSITKIGKSSASDGSNTITITTSTTGNNMIAIVSNQTGGDGGFSNYAISAASEIIVTNANGVASYVTTNSLDFSSLTDITAYVATGLTASAVTVEPATIVPAGAAIVVKATDKAVTNHSVPVATSAVPDGYTNIFNASDGSYTVADDDYTYALNLEGNFQRVASGVTIPSGKAYLKSDTPLAAKTLTLDFGQTTGISTPDTNTNSLKAKKFIKNGNLVIVKGNVEYNTVGAQLK